MEIDYDYLRTGTATGFRVSHELCSNYLFLFIGCLKKGKGSHAPAGA